MLAPMDGITDAPMRALQGATGAFTYTVSEFLRVSGEPIPAKVFLRDVPELARGGATASGLPVQVQLLGGDPGRMATSAATACKAGARGIDINFGCPAPTVNRHDGGASLLNHPCRIREIVATVRKAVPAGIPVSAKLRLGWESIEAIYENAAMAAEGGASWLTIHARTRVQGYAPPVYWKPIRQVREALGLPVIANGDIWTFEDLQRCRDETGCRHFMIGRSALADPSLPHRIALELGIGGRDVETNWMALFQALADLIGEPKRALTRLKQWIKIAHLYGDFPYFHELKRAETLAEFFEALQRFYAADATLPQPLPEREGSSQCPR
ncbi:MAG: tRNA dihydrouridine synthase [Fimbriimonadales bacterium]